MTKVEYLSAAGSAGTVRAAGLPPRKERGFAFTCGGPCSIDDPPTRRAAIRDDDGGSPGDTLAEYAYLGLGRIVTEDYVQPQVKLNYDSGTPGEYAGFDRFDRVIDHLWYAYGASADRDRYTYGYDRASNRLYRENTLTTGRDELYGYDQVDRLVAFQRGELNATKDGITGTPAKAEEWGLDTTGNWDAFLQKTSGTTELEQGRTHNPVNEITAITAATGTDWADPAHDRAGNMTTIPKPANLADGLTATYDAWNRLVEVKDGQNVIARYDYDGLNRRIKSHIDSDAPSNPTGIDSYVHYYHNSSWQILETRQSDTPSAEPESLQPKHQYVWSQRYVDAAVLRDENTGANGLCDDQRLYYLNDANFNVTALLDTAGDAVERYVYSPYGVVTIYDATWTNSRSTSTYANVTLYTGRELDPETGLYYYRNRYYSAELGRFVSRDPITYAAASIHLYRYAMSQAVTLVDPMGLLEIYNVDNSPTCIVPTEEGEGGYYWGIMVGLSDDDRTMVRDARGAFMIFTIVSERQQYDCRGKLTKQSSSTHWFATAVVMVHGEVKMQHSNDFRRARYQYLQIVNSGWIDSFGCDYMHKERLNVTVELVPLDIASNLLHMDRFQEVLPGTVDDWGGPVEDEVGRPAGQRPWRRGANRSGLPRASIQGCLEIDTCKSPPKCEFSSSGELGSMGRSHRSYRFRGGETDIW